MTLVIDMDSHLRDSYFLDEIYDLKGEFANSKPKRRNNPDDIREVEFEHPFTGSSAEHDWIYHRKTNWLGGEIAERQEGGFDMKRRVADNDKEGIDKQIVFPTKISIPALEPGNLGVELARCYNNWVHHLVKGRENRLLPCAIMPAGKPEAMADELRRCVKELGFKVAHLTPYTRTRTLDEEAFFPFFAAAEELDVALMCHPNSGGPMQNMFHKKGRPPAHFPNHVLGRPFNCTMGLAGLVCGGVFEKFPKLRVCFFECSAEWILYWMHRMDDDFEFMKHGFSDLKTQPSDLIRRNVWVTCEVDEGRMDRVFEEFPDSHVLMASDYPHYDSEFPHTVSGIRARSDLSDKRKEMILGRNAEELIGV